MERKKYAKVYVEITNQCNRDCTFCPGTARAPRRMSLAEFDTVTDKLRGVTDYIYLHVMGEPLTHPDVGRMTALAASKGFHVAVTTNGTLLARRGEELITSGVYKVNVSIHSFEEGAREEYLRYLRSCFDFADEASRRGVLVVLRLWNRGFDGGRNLDTVALMRERLSGEWQEGRRGIRIRHGLHLEYGDRFEWPDPTAEYRGEQVFCYGLKDQFGVLSDGRVIPCCLDREGEITLGNLLEDGMELDDILSSDRAERMRHGFARRHATEELCRHCGYAEKFKK